MSYRITLNRPPVIECDTIEEVLALAEVAMQRPAEFADPGPRERIELPATTVQPRITGSTETRAKPPPPKQAAKSIAAYLRQKGKAARVSELCRELSLSEPTVQSVLGGPEFLGLGKGFFRLADGEQPAASPAAAPAKRRGRPPKSQQPEPEAESDPDDDWEDPVPPARKLRPAKASPPRVPNLAERIRSVLKEFGALGTSTIALHVEQPGSLVKEVLRSRPDWFRADGSGWELV